MQYVWQHQLIPLINLATVDGKRVSIINPGMINNDAGPDFFNADIKIDDQQWVGNIEFHNRASDWFRHGHDKDPAYDSVILHIVYIDDVPVFRKNGERIPQMELKCDPNLNAHFSSLVNNSPSLLTCAYLIKDIPPVYISDWLTTLSIQRLQRKAQTIADFAKNYDNDWDNAFYIIFARALGFGTNADPFERLARSTPLKFLRRHADNTLAIESILLGQAGLLNDNISENEYLKELKDNYRFYCHKFDLKNPGFLNWKLSKMRPQNFPHRRIAFLAALIANSIINPQVMYKDDTPEDIRLRLSVDLTGFWSNHYSFNSDPTPFSIQPSRATLDLIIINAVIPMLYAWGHYNNEEWRIDKAHELLTEMKAENNTLVRMFTDRGIKCPDAFTSQGIIELRKNYCEKRQCLVCRLGHRILTLKSLKY